MSALLKLFDPLRHAAAAFFKHDIALKRDRAGLHFALEDRPSSTPGRKRAGGLSREDAAAQKRRQELALVTQHLGELLAEVPQSRSALRQLVFVEAAIQKKGLRVLHKLPLDVMRRALEQLEGLVTNWSAEGLANLRSKMAVAILDREHMDPSVEADAYNTAAVLDTMPVAASQPEVELVSDEDALAAAYAALGTVAPAEAIELQGELGSRSAKAVAPPVPRAGESAGEIKLRELQN